MAKPARGGGKQRKKMARGLILLGAFALVLAACKGDSTGKTDQSSPEAIAAALDVCAEGRDAFAGQVCADREWAALDGQVREALVAEAAEISDAGAQLLVRNQHRWLTARRISCGIVDSAIEPSAEQQACLEHELRARARDARNAVQKLGGYTFQRMELVNANPVSAAVAEASGLGEFAPAAITRDIRFPRIDGPQTPAIQRFNELAAQQPQYRLEDATNEVVDYSIAFAGPELVSVRFDISADTLGAAHPNSTSKAVTVLMAQRRALGVADVFVADSGWQDFLTERAVADIARQFREDGFTPPERDVRETATKPHLWLITEAGLTILFPPYSFGAPYVMGGVDVSISWSDLRPYLNPAAPAPIRG
jgi:uncharacterized protein YecT (DUF1311 family)